MRNKLFFSMIVLICACREQPEDNRTLTISRPSLLREYKSDYTNYITAPEGYTKISEVTSNLDGDDVPETSVVLESNTAVDNKRKRGIRIFRRQNGKLELWHTISGGILPNDLSEPFGDGGELLIDDDRFLVLFHHGGERTDGTHFPQMAHYFQLKNGEWRLKRAHIVTGETIGGRYYATECDYDAETGELTLEKTADRAYFSDSTAIPPKEIRTFSFPLKELPKLEGFVPGTVCIPGTKTVYL